MADLRAVFDINGMGPVLAVPAAYGATITFDKTQFGDSAAVGLAVTVSGDGQVDLCQDADPVNGKLLHVEFDGWCTVQVTGGCLLAGGNGATLTDGTRIVGALGAASAKGYIRSTAATAAEAAKARHAIWSAADATKVQVLLS